MLLALVCCLRGWRLRVAWASSGCVVAAALGHFGLRPLLAALGLLLAPLLALLQVGLDLAAKKPVIVSDARKDERLLDNLAIRDLGVIAYLGVPLITRDGYVVGTLCVIDHEPRIWTNDEIGLVQDIASAVGTEITLRTNHRSTSPAARKQANSG